MWKLVFILLISVSATLAKSQIQSQSALSTGVWYKYAVSKTGIYSITGQDLESSGISTLGIDPAKIRVFGNPGGMLPQANSSKRPIDLEELAIKVMDGGDGKIDAFDKILFWAEGPNKVHFDESSQSFLYENNIYSDTSYYFLTLNQGTGKRIGQASSTIGTHPVVDTHKVYYVHELDRVNILSSGRAWYGEDFFSKKSQTFSTTLSNWIIGSNAKITSSVMSASTSSTTFTIFINGVNIGSQHIQGIRNTQYAIKGIEKKNTFTFSPSINNNKNIEVKYVFEKENGTGYLNYFLVETENNIVLEKNYLKIIIPKKTQPTSTLEAISSTSTVELWNVINFNTIKKISLKKDKTKLEANIKTDTTATLVLLDSMADFPSPKFIGKVLPQNLHGISATELLIITAPKFINQAIDLKNYKLSQGLITTVATTHQIYNEFSSGRKDITAIRDFVRYLYKHAGLKYVLLFGKGTYDYKNIEKKNNSFVPIYESINSLDPLHTYGSDDYIGFMDENEGVWEEKNSSKPTLDIGIGRLPIKSVKEAEAVVEKIKKYQSKTTAGRWKKKLILIAEDGDSNIHQQDAEHLSSLIDSIHKTIDIQKIYVDAYPIEALAGGKKAPLVNKAIAEVFEKGAFIVNYTGHGDEGQWANSAILTLEMINNLPNTTSFPLLVTATCEFGRHDDANQVSAGEVLVLKPNAGTIGLITTSRPVFSSSNYRINAAFYKHVFARKEGEYSTLGDIFKDTKNTSLTGVNGRNFILLADPSLKLSYPQKTVQIDSLRGNFLQKNDTIKALEKVTFSGSIRNENGTLATSYAGEVFIKYYDKSTKKQTLGNFGPSFKYIDRDNFLFAGKSTIKNGVFTFTFIVPLDIVYHVQEGKISMYAISSSDSTDASGATGSIRVGKSVENKTIDNTPPTIHLFMEDLSFKNKSLVSANSLLIVHLADESGINLSKTQIGHHTTYTLDNNDPIPLNDYFEYDLDSYQEGKIIFPIQNIPPGYHSLKVRTWDIHNNMVEEEITFNVAFNQEVHISKVSVFPNPIKSNATFSFKHNLSEEEIEVHLSIINRSGKTVYYKEKRYKNSHSIINDITWDSRNTSGQKLAEGVYIYKVFLRSITSNNRGSFHGRLMVVN